jgi:hypothetical protein
MQEVGTHPPPDTIQQAGVTLDLPKLDKEFQNASPALQGAATQIKTLYYRGQLAKAVAELSRLSTNPGLTESQKKLVTDLAEQMKQAIAASASPGPQ